MIIVDEINHLILLDRLQELLKNHMDGDVVYIDENENKLKEYYLINIPTPQVERISYKEKQNYRNIGRSRNQRKQY